MAKKIDVLLVDDHAVVRTGYKTYLSLSTAIGEIYEADCGEEACQLYHLHQPDVVILDMSMPGIGGFETIRRLILRDSQCKILVFSIHDELVFVARAIKAGAKGYITKNSSPDILTTAVCTIAGGGSYLLPELAQKLAVSFAQDGGEENLIQRLSPREFDVFCLLANGLTTRAASEKLCLGYKTVCNHTTAIKEKLEIQSIAEIALLANRLGLLTSI
jgi:DNA-binding NarL/FixJ family response regulator